MLERLSVELISGANLSGAMFRYGVLERLARVTAPRHVRVLAFGFSGRDLRLVVEGAERDIAEALRGLKVGTVRAAAARGLDCLSGPTFRKELEARELEDAVVWAHSGPVDAGASGPLASPWSSHRDLLAFRSARWLDASALRARVDARRVHERCGGRALPAGWPPPERSVEDLDLLLRVAGAVLGVLPADRRCFRLFVHLARKRGHGTAALARGLALTKRRIRQLAATPEPMLDTALTTLADPRLCRVP